MTVKAGSTTALTVSPTGAVTMSGGFTMGDDLTFTKAAAAITHTGATSFTISSTGTAGTVTVESVVFDGGAVSGVTTLATSGAITSVAGDLIIKSDATTPKFSVAAATGNTAVAGTLAVTGTVTSTGDFAVGANTLTVAAATGNTAVGGTLAVTGTTTIAAGTHSGSWGPSSDARWKHSVQNMSRPLDAVMALRPVQFEWNADSPAARSQPIGAVLPSQVGFIAQEVRDALPANVSDSLVFEVDAEGHLAVDYSKFTALLVGAVQEQQHRSAQLQQDMEE